MYQSAIYALTFATAALLSACGGGGSGSGSGAGTGPNQPQTPSDSAYYMGDDDSMAARISNATSLEEATTFKAMTVGMNHTFDANDNNIPELTESQDITFQIFRTSPDAVPTFVVAHGGETNTFGPEHAPDNENYAIEGPGDSDDKFLWTWAGYPLDHASGFDWGDWIEEGQRNPLDYKYHIPVGIYYSRGDQGLADLRRYAVIGLETAPGDMPTHDVSAVYDGIVRMDLYPLDGESDRTRLDASITLTANFSESTIGGVIDNWINRDDDSDDLSEVSYMLTPTTIAGNGYTTSMARSAACPDCPELVSSTVAGKFYGPAGSETGGTIQAQFRGDDESSDDIAVGIFYTNQN